jgi:hypothetical protein
MKKIVLLIILLTTTGLQAQEEVAKAPRILIRIPFGQTANIDGVQITFAEVLEDSRCPAKVTCVWEGRAKVKVLITEEGLETVEKAVIFGKALGDESKDKVLYECNDFILKAIQLVPYPQEPTDRLNYIVLVDKLEKG